MSLPERLRQEAERLGAKGLAGVIDHTVLKPETTPGMIEKVVRETERYGFACAVVPPTYVDYAVSISNARICTVIGFPFGYAPLKAKEAELEHVLNHGVAEVDIVMNVALFKARRLRQVEEELSVLTRLAKERGTVVKIIIETSLLDDDKIVEAARLVERVGADYVKTNTGYGKRGATVRDVLIIRGAISERMGVKAAGGIRTAVDALLMLEAGANRIGTSTGPQIVEDLGRVLLKGRRNVS